MKKSRLLLLTGACLPLLAPPAHAQQAPSPYRTRFVVDAPITAGLIGAAGAGFYMLKQKNGLTQEQLSRLDRNDVPKFDRFAAGNYSDRAQKVGDALCYPSMVVAPALLVLNDNVRGRYGQVLGLYVQSLALTDAAFTLTVGNVYRYRPYLYGDEGGNRPGSQRTGRIATNSFFAGHTAHTAVATFFAAKVFHDFNPDSPARPYVWTTAALVPAVVAYTRIEAGKHFLSDNLVGYTVGAASGILVPQLHKTAGRRGMSVSPLQGVNANGFAYSGFSLTKQL